MVFEDQNESMLSMKREDCRGYCLDDLDPYFWSQVEAMGLFDEGEEEEEGI